MRTHAWTPVAPPLGGAVAVGYGRVESAVEGMTGGGVPITIAISVASAGSIVVGTPVNSACTASAWPTPRG